MKIHTFSRGFPADREVFMVKSRFFTRQPRKLQKREPVPVRPQSELLVPSAKGCANSWTYSDTESRKPSRPEHVGGPDSHEKQGAREFDVFWAGDQVYRYWSAYGIK